MANEDDPIADILCVCEALGTTYFLVITYYAEDPGKAAGYVFRRKAGTDDPAENILATNDTLRTLWCSPAGHLWSTSTNGLVWTTAPVQWPSTVTEPDMEFEAPEGGLDWRHVALPPQQHNGLPPNATAIWGSSDDDVHVASFGGVMYRWDGEAWSQYFSGIGESIGVIRGQGRSDVYAAGFGSTILHFDGRAWSVIPDPDGSQIQDTLTGVAFDKAGRSYICGKSRGGRLLRGGPDGFSVLGRYDVPFIGVANGGGRLIFAAAQKGVVELTSTGLVALRDDIIPWAVAEGEGRLYFTETPGEPVYSELDLQTGQWRRLSY
jgi:hypothetical protein